jgi:hypothetical protein
LAAVALESDPRRRRRRRMSAPLPCLQQLWEVWWDRRERYRGRCLGCGRPSRGSDGPGHGPEWCPDCGRARRRRWSDAQMLEAVRDWMRLTGKPPTLDDWSPAHAPAGHKGAARSLAERAGCPMPAAWRGASARCARQSRGQVAGTPKRRFVMAPERVSGRRVDDFPPRRRTPWLQPEHRRARVPAERGARLRRSSHSRSGARLGARARLRLTSRSEADERPPDRPKTGLTCASNEIADVERQLALGNAELTSIDISEMLVPFHCHYDLVAVARGADTRHECPWLHC